jgi:hypothetical protein
MDRIMSASSRTILVRLLLISMLAALLLNGCGLHPSKPATPVPTATAAPVQASTLEGVLGEWVTLCAAGPCIFTINADGTYEQRTLTTSTPGASLIDRGVIILSRGIFHFVSITGGCQEKPDGYYQAFLSEAGGNTLLNFRPIKVDECPDRQQSLSRWMNRKK